MGKQTKLAVGECDHRSLEPVVNGNDVTIAWRCSACTDIRAHQGDCDGVCGKKDVRLVKHVAGARPKRYCTEGCWSNTMKAKRKAVEEASKLTATPTAPKVSYMHGRKPGGTAA